MKNVIGKLDIIKLSQQAPAGSKYSFVNWEAVNELPEEFESIVAAVKFDPTSDKSLSKDFTNISGKYMPTTDMCYKIAEACGISGCESSRVEAVYEDVDINFMLLKPAEAPPTHRKIKVGELVTKQSKRLMEDGTFLYSSPCTSIYNVWERCLDAWATEEKYTKGYTQKTKWPNKYEYPYDRRAHFNTEMKFAHAKAESKAYCKTIRELASLPTAFERADLAKGMLIFSKSRRSSSVLKLETLARLAALSNGNKQAAIPLFDDEPEPIPEPIPIVEESLLVVLEHYKKVSKTTELDGAIAWLKTIDIKDAKNKGGIEKAITLMKKIEQGVEPENRIDHIF